MKRLEVKSRALFIGNQATDSLAKEDFAHAAKLIGSLRTLVSPEGVFFVA